MNNKQKYVHPFALPSPRITGKHLAWLRDWVHLWNEGTLVIDGKVMGDLGLQIWRNADRRHHPWTHKWAVRAGNVTNAVREHVDCTRIDSDIWGLHLSASAPVYAYWDWLSRAQPTHYPYQSVLFLWEEGLIPSFDGATWRLHGGPDGRVLWEGTL